MAAQCAAAAHLVAARVGLQVLGAAALLRELGELVRVLGVLAGILV